MNIATQPNCSKFLEESLAKSENVKDKMIAILDRFEDRFSKLEIEMNSMNKRIDVLKLAHDSMLQFIQLFIPFCRY
jgi:flagellar capping protein FliD